MILCYNRKYIKFYERKKCQKKNMSDRPGTNILWKFAVQLQSVLLATEAVKVV